MHKFPPGRRRMSYRRGRCGSRASDFAGFRNPWLEGGRPQKQQFRQADRVRSFVLGRQAAFEGSAIVGDKAMNPVAVEIASGFAAAVAQPGCIARGSRLPERGAR
jgi:hypothetical protein